MLILRSRKMDRQATCKQALPQLIILQSDSLWSQLKLDKIKFADSVNEKESLKSIQTDTNDIFLEIQEKVSAVFNLQGFAIYIKISGMVLIKNYIHNRVNLRIQFNEDFQVNEEQKFTSSL